jgi:o-succinylbenzoate---CoA ligase
VKSVDSSLYLPDWLARRAALHPERPAVIAGGVAHSFAALDAWASAIAADLVARGAACTAAA